MAVKNRELPITIYLDSHNYYTDLELVDRIVHVLYHDTLMKIGDRLAFGDYLFEIVRVGEGSAARIEVQEIHMSAQND